MKLRTKIAGTLALPLALAVAANVNAAQITDELKIGGFVAATANWVIEDNADNNQSSDIDAGLDLGTSRINVSYTKNGVNVLYENDWAGGDYRLRHAVISYDGWVAGYTWSAFSNRTALAETIDANGPTLRSAYAQRTATLGKNINLAEGMSLGLFIEDKTHGLDTETKGNSRVQTLDTDGKKVDDRNSAIPDIAVNFKGDFGVAQAFAAVRMMQVNKAPTGGKAKTEGAVDFTLGVNSQLTDEFNLKFAATMFDKKSVTNISEGSGSDIGLQLGAQYKFNDQVRANVVVEHYLADLDNNDYTAVWVNGFYKLDNGWEWGAELASVTGDGASHAKTRTELGDKDLAVSLLAKYSF